MSENPILMHDRSMRGILNDRKTQTRRLIRPRGKLPSVKPDATLEEVVANPDGTPVAKFKNPTTMTTRCACPYGAPGDTLWVREAWKPVTLADAHVVVEYRASAHTINGRVPHEIEDQEMRDQAARFFKKNAWGANIHMPRWACRVLLTLDTVRVERLHDMDRQDCYAEGVPRKYSDPRSRFAHNWKDTHSHHQGRYGWDANPWVWVLEFTIHDIQEGFS